MQSVVRSQSIAWVDLGFRQECLESNLATLAERDPEIAAQIGRAGPHGALSIVTRESTVRPLVARVHRRRPIVIEETADELEQAAEEAWGHPEAPGFLVVGVGTGERLGRLLRRLQEGHVVYAWDPDPALWVLALARHDWTTWLADGRLQPMLGTDLLNQPLPEVSSAFLHPRLGPLLLPDWRELKRRLGTRRMRPQGSVALLAGELLHDEIVLGLEESGRGVAILDPLALTRDQIERELVRLDPEALISVNFIPEAAAIAGRLGIRYRAWEIDPTASPIESPSPGSAAARWTRIHTWRRARVRELQAAGWSAAWLPLAAHEEFRKPAIDACQRIARPVFVGSCLRRSGDELWSLLSRSAALDSARAAEWTAFLAEMNLLVEAVRRDPGRRDVTASITSCLVDRGLPDLIDTEAGPAQVSMLVGERLASVKRIAVVQALVRLGAVVFGEDEWRDAVDGVDYRGSVGNGAALNAVYSNAALIVDVNRNYQPDIVTLRTFETLACGGFILAEAADDQRHLFDLERELVTWSSIDELREKAHHFLGDHDERRVVAECGRARLLRDHTISQRLTTLLG